MDVDVSVHHGRFGHNDSVFLCGLGKIGKKSCVKKSNASVAPILVLFSVGCLQLVLVCEIARFYLLLLLFDVYHQTTIMMMKMMITIINAAEIHPTADILYLAKDFSHSIHKLVFVNGIVSARVFFFSPSLVPFSLYLQVWRRNFTIHQQFQQQMTSIFGVYVGHCGLKSGFSDKLIDIQCSSAIEK